MNERREMRQHFCTFVIMLSLQRSHSYVHSLRITDGFKSFRAGCLYGFPAEPFGYNWPLSPAYNTIGAKVVPCQIWVTLKDPKTRAFAMIQAGCRHCHHCGHGGRLPSKLRESLRTRRPPRMRSQSRTRQKLPPSSASFATAVRTSSPFCIPPIKTKPIWHAAASNPTPRWPTKPTCCEPAKDQCDGAQMEVMFQHSYETVKWMRDRGVKKWRLTLRKFFDENTITKGDIFDISPGGCLMGAERRRRIGDFWAAVEARKAFPPPKKRYE